MKYPIIMIKQIIVNHIYIHIISIYTVPQKKEFVLKFQENNNICTTRNIKKQHHSQSPLDN